MNDDQLYPTQLRNVRPATTTLSSPDIALGAPFAPLPRSFFQVDPRLEVCQPIDPPEAIQAVVQMRAAFCVDTFPSPYVADVMRAFRLLKGKTRYLEIGIFDRGNLAYVSSLLTDDAHLIGVDVQSDEPRDILLRSHLKKGQRYDFVAGSSRSPECVAQVRELLQGQKLDAVFIDGDHSAYAAMSDYALYEEFIAHDGVILLHDTAWEGDENYKGVADALAEIDRVEPVYQVDGSNPCRRFLRPMWRDSLWGIVGVVFASDQAWRRHS